MRLILETSPFGDAHNKIARSRPDHVSGAGLLSLRSASRSSAALAAAADALLGFIVQRR